MSQLLGVGEGGIDVATVNLVYRGPFALLTLDNPRYHNCMTHAMWSQLETEARQLAHDKEIRAVVLRGKGNDFTSGFDLSELNQLDSAAVNAEFELMERAIAAVEAIPVPVIAQLSGYVLGGGFELALAADLRLADTSVKMGMPIARIGIMLSRTFARRLVQIMGLTKAKELLFTGYLIGAQDALALSIVNEITDDPATFDQVVERWLRDITAMYPRAVRQAKMAVSEVSDKALEGYPYFVDANDFFEATRRFRRTHP